MTVIYLCGAINGCSDDEAMGWRERVKRELAGQYTFLDPMRRDYRGREAECVDEIVLGDLADIDACGIVLAAADRPSWGTAMEIRVASEYGKPVFVVCNADRPSPWLLHHATKLTRTLTEAIAFLASQTGEPSARAATTEGGTTHGE